jgi:putative ABC transport system ATP-binding protein
MLRFENITLILNAQTPLERKILHNLNLEIKQGEFVVVMGGNGAGKSTFFNVISGFILPNCGKIFIDQKDVTKIKKRTKFVSKVMQDPKIGTIENMTIFENMSFAYKRGLFRGFKSCFDKERIKIFEEKLALLNMGLEKRMNTLVGHLSGGQRQALSLIMSILQKSKVLLLDEITAALDPSMSESVMMLSNKIIKEQNQTCLMITHNIDHALRYGDRLIILKDGQFQTQYKKTPNLTHQEIAKHFM